MLDKLQDYLRDQTPTSEDEYKLKMISICDEKIEFIREVLFEYTAYLDAFLDTKEVSYQAQLKKLGEMLRELKDNTKNKKSGKNKKDKAIEWLEDDNVQIEFFRILLNPGYEPPVDPVAVQFHLQVIWFFYLYLLKTIKEVPLTLEMRIDLAMAKLVRLATFIMSEANNMAYHRSRVRKSREVKRKKNQINRKLAIEMFPKLIELYPERKSQIWSLAGEAHDLLVNKIKPPIPVPNTIVRWWKDAGLINNKT
jgi:hypothetical protein